MNDYIFLLRKYGNKKLRCSPYVFFCISMELCMDSPYVVQYDITLCENVIVRH